MSTSATNPPPLPPKQLEDFGARQLAPAGPWGFWATLGFFILIAMGFLGGQIAGSIAFTFSGPSRALHELEHNGSLLAWATIAATPVAVGLCWLFAWCRRLRSGFPTTVYLGFIPVRWRTLGLWCLAVLALILVSDLVTWLMGKPIVPEVMVELYRSTEVLPLLWLALIVLAPIGEEVMFRGFLLPGLSRTRLGNVGAIALTSAAWASIHFQYDFHGVALIFFAGLLLGAARIRTGSIAPCVVMHAVQNIVSTVETAVIVAGR